MPTFNGTSGDDVLTISTATPNSSWQVDGDTGNVNSPGDRLILNWQNDTDGLVDRNPIGGSRSWSSRSLAGDDPNYIFIRHSRFENFTLNLGSGSDDLFTGDGDDIVNSGGGNDIIDTGAGIAAIDLGSGVDTWQANLSAIAGDGTLDLAVATSQPFMGGSVAGVEALDLTVGSGNHTIYTLAGAAGVGLNDTIDAGGGDDVIKIGGGSDRVTGGAGTDLLIVDLSNDTNGIVDRNPIGGSRSWGSRTLSASDTGYVFIRHDTFERIDITLGSGDDIVFSGGGDDVVSGSGGADTLDAGAGVDVLNGGSGNDTLIGGAGDDTMAGGLGDDVYDVRDAGDVVNEVAGEGVDTVVSYVSGYSLGENVENLVMGGSIVVGFGNASANAIFGNDAANTLNGAGGADVMIGGKGNDDYVVTEMGDVVQEASGQGTDSVFSFVDGYGLSANVENLILQGSAQVGFGNSGANGLFGNALNNTLIGGAGNDLMAGGAGDDTYEVTEAGDVVSEAAGQGTDQVFSFVDGYVLAANVENLILAGSTVTGFGNASANAVIGNAAANNVGGGGGDDFVVGGAGVDTFFWTGTSAGKDVLVDFAQANEKIVVSSSMFANFAAVQSHAFQAGGDTVISYDSNTLLVLKNTTLANLTAGNFVFSASEQGGGHPSAAPFAPEPEAALTWGGEPTSSLAHVHGFDWMLA